eukprot:GHVQ01011762.1.p1 GENE.GHVQ01011762.1~~GHVQ01011762.1.p1  ORF type:complete len:210 (+),score=33.25 GHVQ01011762.1:65-694(+)
MNQSLWCIDPSNHGLYKDGTRDTNCVYGLSDIARHFIAGQLHHMDALTAIFAPDVNSYRRFCINSFAPTTVTWGFENRTAAVRVKVREDSALWENRVCAAPVNPYLAYAVSVAAGIDGINKKMDLQQPLNGSAYDTQLLPKLRPLPQSLEDAIRSLQKDQVSLYVHFGCLMVSWQAVWLLQVCCCCRLSVVCRFAVVVGCLLFAGLLLL